MKFDIANDKADTFDYEIKYPTFGQTNCSFRFQDVQTNPGILIWRARSKKVSEKTFTPNRQEREKSFSPLSDSHEKLSQFIL